jgi:transcriptional regulator with XRE-family HTH domain
LSSGWGPGLITSASFFIHGIDKLILEVDKYRKKHNLSARQFGMLLGDTEQSQPIGVTLRRWRKHQARNVSANTLIKIAKAIDFDLNILKLMDGFKD